MLQGNIWIRENWEFLRRVWLPKEQDKGETAKSAPAVRKEIICRVT